MDNLTKLLLVIFFITSYAVIGYLAWTLRGVVEKTKQEEATANRKRWTTYDKEGRVRNG